MRYTGDNLAGEGGNGEEGRALDRLRMLNESERFNRDYRLASFSPSGFEALTAQIDPEQLRRDTVMPVADIASAVGYGSSEHFIRTFRKHVGMPPADTGRRSGHKHKHDK